MATIEILTREDLRDFDHIKEAVLEAATRAAHERGLTIEDAMSSCFIASLDIAIRLKDRGGIAAMRKICLEFLERSAPIRPAGNA